MANDVNIMKNVGVVARAAAVMFEDNLAFCKSIAKADESDYKGKNGYSAGDTIQISKPARFIAGSDFDITSSIQDVVEEKVPLKLDVISTIAVDFDSQELAHDITTQAVIERVIKPAVSSMAHDVENKMLKIATQSVYNSVGTAGSTVFDPDTILSARAKMGKYLCPKDAERYFLFESEAGRSAVNARKGLFQSSDEISKQYKQGLVGIADGFKWMESEMLQTHTNGTDVTGVQIDATVASQGVTTIAVKGLTNTTGTVTKGTVFTISGVKAVHPITKVAYPFLQQFVVTADATADGTGDATLSISPAIHSTSTGLKNVTALPQEDANLVFVGAADGDYIQNLAYHKRAFRMASVPLEMPTNAEFAQQKTHKGITIAVIKDFDVLKRRWITRLDFLGAITADRPEWASKITS